MDAKMRSSSEALSSIFQDIIHLLITARTDDIKNYEFVKHKKVKVIKYIGAIKYLVAN